MFNFGDNNFSFPLTIEQTLHLIWETKQSSSKT
jgi:hypothetical protein